MQTTLNASNDFGSAVRDLVINNGALVRLYADWQVRDSSGVFANGSTFDLGGFSERAHLLSLNAGALIGGGNSTWLAGADHGDAIASSGSSTIAATNVLLAGQIPFSVNSGTLTVNGMIGNWSQAGSLLKNGNGTLALGGSSVNTFTGGTIVNQGTLVLDRGVDGALHDYGVAVGNLTINAGATVRVQQYSQIKNSAAVVINNGTLDFQGPYIDSVGSLSINSGSVTGAGGIGFTSIDAITSTGNSSISSLRVIPQVASGDFHVNVVDGVLSVPSGFEGTSPGQRLRKSGIGELRLPVGSASGHNGGSQIDAGKLTVNGAHTSSITVNAAGALAGSGTIGGSVSTDGLVTPGNSAGIMTINGNCTQSPSGTLEIEVGGLTPGSQHDRVNIGGTAALGGQLDVPIVNGYVPQIGDSVTILTSPNVTGKFAGVFAPDLVSANPNVAMAIVRTATNVQLQFVAPLSNIQFDPATTVVDWASTDTWSTGAQPDSRHVVTVENPAGVDQRVDVQNDDALVHELIIGGDSNHTTTVAINNGRTLSATARTRLNNGGILDLGSFSSPGLLTTPKVEIQPGAVLKGNGTIGQKKSDIKKLLDKRNVLTNRGISGPGRSVGYLEIDGDYIQEPEGSLEIELASLSSFDKFLIAGSATLGGTLDVVLLNFTPQPGDSFDFIDWESVTGTFDSVNLPSLGGGLTWDLSQLYITGSLSVAGTLGDYDLDGSVDVNDFTVWRQGFGTSGIGLASDGNRNGVVDAADYVLWRDHFGQGNSALAATVPEPTSAAISMIVVLFAFVTASTLR